MLQLIDLRRAALREYPEFGAAPQPLPWYDRTGPVVFLQAVFWVVFSVLLVLLA